MRLLICTPYRGILYFWHFVSVPQRPSGAGEWNSSHAVRCGGDGCKNHYRLYAHRPMGIYGDLYGEPLAWIAACIPLWLCYQIQIRDPQRWFLRKRIYPGKN